MYGGAHGEGEKVRMKRAVRDAGCPTVSPPPPGSACGWGGVIPPPTYIGRPGGGEQLMNSPGCIGTGHTGENSGRAIT